MEELQKKLAEFGDKLDIYQKNMENLANFSERLTEKAKNLDEGLKRTKRENKLGEIQKNLKQLGEKLEDLKEDFGAFSDEKSLTHQGLERIFTMAKIIREIDNKTSNLSKYFSNININDIDLFLQNSGRFMNSAKAMKEELMGYSKKLEKEQNIKKDMQKKLLRLEDLRKQNEKLEGEIKEKLLKMNDKQFVEFNEKLKNI